MKTTVASLNIEQALGNSGNEKVPCINYFKLEVIMSLRHPCNLTNWCVSCGFI